MATVSAGILMYRRHHGMVQVMLVHPGGPYFKNKDLGSWSIPKGEVAEGEDMLTAAQREFEEEIGFRPTGQFIQLSPVKQKGGKVVHAWAVKGDFDIDTFKSNTFT